MAEENTDQVDMGNEGNQVIEPQPETTAQRVEPLAEEPISEPTINILPTPEPEIDGSNGSNPPPPEATAGQGGENGIKEEVEPEPAPTAQPVEPLDSELQTAPEPPTQTSESPQEPAENQISPEPQVEPVSSETSQPAEPIPASAEGFNVAIPEPVSEPVPQPEQETASELTSQPKPTPESAPDSTSSPQATPEPQVIASAFSVSRARELLIKAREMIQFRKRKKLEKIMSLFLKKQSITNDDVQMLVYVSDATATRYLQQLEREGRIKKENAGKYLSYSRM